MAVNIEIKARVHDFANFRRLAEDLSDVPVKVIKQVDTFFHTGQGRLKLRELGSEPAQLVYYERPDHEGPKRSDYRILETNDPESLKAILKLALGVRGVVRKTRYLYLVGQTRVHLDDVEGLGKFMELEVVLHPDQSDEDGEMIARELMRKLGVNNSDLLEGAYMDLMESRE